MALEPNINDSIIVPANPALEPATISISLWVQSIPENHIRVLIDSTHGTGQAGWALQLNAANNASFAYGNGSTFPEVTATSLIGDGKFHHVGATLDGTTMRLYVDGTLESTLPYSGTPKPSTRDIQLGNHLRVKTTADLERYKTLFSPDGLSAIGFQQENRWTRCIFWLIADS